MASVLAYTGLAQQEVEIQEAAAGSANDFYAGDLVKANSSGELIIATAGKMLGIAHKAATGTASTEIPVALLNINEIYVSRYHTDATSEALIGDLLDYTFTAGAHTLEESGATTDVYCVGLHPNDGAVASGRLLVRFLGTVFTSSF
jgi:hypothetical protein